MFSKSCQPEIVFVLIYPLAEQFYGHRSYITLESKMSCIGNFDENIDLSYFRLAVKKTIAEPYKLKCTLKKDFNPFWIIKQTNHENPEGR